MDLTFDTNLRLVFRTKLHLAEHKMEKIKLSDEKYRMHNSDDFFPIQLISKVLLDSDQSDLL